MRPNARIARTCGCLLGLSCVLYTVAAIGYAGEPRGWRGDGSGQFADADPPVKWSQKEGILWKAPLPGGGYSSPVFANDQLFVTADPSHVVCISANDGSVLWQADAGYAAALGKEKAAEIHQTHARFDEELEPLKSRHDALLKSDPQAAELSKLKKQIEAIEQRRSEYSKQFPSEKRGGAGNTAATPATDGERVFVTFGTGIVAAFDLDGQRLWVRHVEVSQAGWGHSASPVIADGKLIVHFPDLIALDRNTGQELWRAKAPARQGTPAVAKLGDDDVVVTPSGAIVAAGDGRILAEKLFDMPVASPIVHEGMIYAHGVGIVKAIRLPASADEPIDTKPVWEAKCGRDERLASAVWHDGLLYSGTRPGVLEVLEAETGKAVYRKRLQLGELYPSLAAAGDSIFISGAEGKTLVLKPGRKFEELGTNQLDRFSTTPVFAGQRMYVRIDKHLCCIGR